MLFLKRTSWLLLLAFITNIVGNVAVLAEEDWSTRQNRALSFVFSNKDKYRYDIPYRLVMPINYDTNKKYPLIFEMTPERGDDNTRQLDTNSIARVLTEEQWVYRYQCFILLPMCPKGTDFHIGMESPMNDVMEASLEILDEVLEQYSIDRNRIYTGGISNAATSTWELIARRPDLFAAAFPIAGGPWDASLVASRITDIPIWTFAAADDRGYVLSSVRKAVGMLEAMGGNIKYTEYPYGNHTIWFSKVYKDPAFFQWLFTQRKTSRQDEQIFNDIDINNPHYNDIMYLYDNNIIDSSDDFRSGDNIELVDFLRWLLFARESSNERKELSKMSNYQIFQEAHKKFILTHKDVGTLSFYDQNITKEQAALLVYRCLEKKYDYNQYASSILDYDMVAPKYNEAVLQSSVLGIMDLTEEKRFEPKKVLNRGESAAILNRLFNPDMRLTFQGLELGSKATSLDVIGNTTTNLIGERNIVRTSETNLGNLVADAMKTETQSDVAIMQGGGVRVSIPSGPITYKHVYTVLPFDNTVVVLEVSGNDIIAALENGLSTYPEPNASFLHVSGMTVKVNPKAPVGSRVKEVRINVDLIVGSKKYRLATNNYIAEGGDGFTMLAKCPVLVQHPTIAEILCDYIKGKGVDADEIAVGRLHF